MILCYGDTIAALKQYIVTNKCTLMLLNLRREELQERPVGAVKFVVILLSVAAGFYGVVSALAQLPAKASFVAPTFVNLDQVRTLLLNA